MNGKELYEKLREMGVNFLENWTLKDLSIGWEPQKFMPEYSYEEVYTDMCDYILQHYDVVFSEDNRIGFTRKEYKLAVDKLLNVVKGE